MTAPARPPIRLTRLQVALVWVAVAAMLVVVGFQMRAAYRAGQRDVLGQRAAADSADVANTLKAAGPAPTAR